MYYHHLCAWYNWEPNAGWYYHAYNSAGNSNSNVWGIFQGPASSYERGGGGYGEPCGTGMYGKPAAGNPTEHGFYSSSRLNGYPNVEHLHRKYSFGIFLGIKGADMPVDFSAFTEYPIGIGSYNNSPPGIAKMHNLRSGTGQFAKQIDQGLDFPDPGGGYSGMYLNRADTETIINRCATDQTFYNNLYNKDPVFRNLWQLFR